jgi:hypothetical protein
MSSTPELYNVADMSLTNVCGFPGMDYLRHNTGKFIKNKQHTTNIYLHILVSNTISISDDIHVV